MNTYITEGVCAKKISFSVDDNKINDVKFHFGCPGNLQGISKLVEGMDIKEVIQKLKGIKCGARFTSCPDQLSKALSEYITN